jgi:MFS family permease
MAAPKRSQRGLDWLNFFVANVQTGFGPFIAVYLTENRWTLGEIGFALSIGTICSLISQVPAGALVDTMQDKRIVVRFGILTISATALLYALSASKAVVYGAEVLHGLASSVVAPAIAAVTLALVGRAAFSERVGRNARYASLGNGLAAGVMGAAGSLISPSAVFWLTAMLGVPALVALRMIGPRRGEAFEAPTDLPECKAAVTAAGLQELFFDRRLLIFGGCIVLYFISSAAMLPLAATQITKHHPELADIIIALTIVVPQGVVALMSPWVGASSDRWGRRPLMMLGWVMLPLQGVLYAGMISPATLVICQILSGVSAAVFGVVLTLVAADLTHESGRFNLTMGSLGVAISIGASISTTLAGVTAQFFGVGTAFLMLALAGAAGVVVLWLYMPETGASTPAAPPSAPPLAGLSAVGVPVAE